MRRIWAALLLLPTLSWAAAFDSDSFDSTNSFDTDSFNFITGQCGVDDTSPVPGTTIGVSGCPAFAGAITTLTSPAGDTITAESGADTTSADFIIPAALTGFVAGGDLQDTEWDLDGTWTVGDGSTTENITIRIDPPEVNGPDYFFGTVVGPEAADSVFPSSAAATSGDEYYVARVSGTNVLVNTNGSTSADDDYEVNATIWDESAGGGAGQWSGAENTVFDATAPAFSSAAIDSAGTLFTLTMDDAVTQGTGYSDSDLTLSCSGGAATLTYSAGDGTTTPDYATSRTIESGETCTVSWSGTVDGLEDGVGNDVASFADESVTNNSSGDTTLPTVSTVTIATNGTDVTIVLDENGNIGSGGSGGFSLVMSGGTTALTYSSGDGTTSLVFNPARTIEASETGTLTYVQPTDGIEDDSGNDLASFSGQALTNNSTADATAPLFSSAAIPSAGTTITITFDESVDIGAGGNGGFAIASCSGGAVTPSYSSGDGSATLTYSLSRTVEGGETGCTVAYTQPGNGLEDSAGNDVATFGAQAVTNNSTADTTAPTVTAAVISGTAYRLTFSEFVTNGAGGSGGYALTCSGGAVTATYASGAGTGQYTLSLSRSVANTETCTRDYTQPTNGAEDLAGNDLATFSGAAVVVLASGSSIEQLRRRRR